MNSFFFVTVDTAGVSVTHPDVIARPRTPIYQSFAVGRLSAEFSDFALGWSPIYPSRLVARPPVNPNRIGTSHAAIVYPTSFVTSWMPTYPLYRAAPRVHRVFFPSVFDPMSGNAMVVAQRMAWYPRFRPIFLRPKIARTQFAYVTPPQTAVGSLTCTAMDDSDLTSPAILSQALTTPTVVSTDLTVPAIINEGLC